MANAGPYAQLVADTARRRRVIDLGIRLAHSDADPAVLAHLAGELAELPRPAVGAAGRHLSHSGLRARCPPSRSRCCPAGWASTWLRSPPPPRRRPTWPGHSPWQCWPLWPPAPSRSSPDPAGASRCACSWPSAWTPGPARAASSPPSPARSPTSNASRRPLPSRRSPRPLLCGASPTRPPPTPKPRPAKPPPTSRKNAKRRRSPGPPRPPPWSCRRCRGGWLMTPPPRPWLGCWPPTAASLSLVPRAMCLTRWPAATTRPPGPTWGVYLKGHAGDLLKVDRRGRPPPNTWSGPV